MNATRLSLLAAGALFSASLAQPAAAESRSAQASIPFGGIADWHAVDDKHLFVMDRSGRWYLASFDTACYRLAVSNRITFRPDLSGRFDRMGSVLTGYGSCPVDSFVRSDPPAAKGLKGVRLPRR